MTENMKKFLELVSGNDELYRSFSNATKEDIVALARELGMELTEADFSQPNVELSDDELDVVAGGAKCECPVYGAGNDSGADEKTCVCVLGGGGEYQNGKCRCACVGGGYGKAG